MESQLSLRPFKHLDVSEKFSPESLHVKSLGMSIMDFFFSAGVLKDTSDRWVFSGSPSATEPVTSAPPVDLDVAIPSKDDDISSPITVQATFSAIDLHDATPQDTGKSKKKKNKKKKAAAHVSWGNVEEICFSRNISYSSVPNRGLFPLGLGEVEDTQHYTVDEFFVKQQLILLDRARALGISVPTSASVQSSPPVPAGLKSLASPHTRVKKGSKNADKPVPPPVPVVEQPKVYVSPLFETRQFDYKAHSSNPIFHPTSEDERLHTLMSNKQTWNKLADSSTNTDAAGHHHSLAETLNREIKTIKSSRDEATGCSCKHVKVDKLSVAKMKSELLTHGHLINYTGSKADVEQLKKADLTAKVKEIVQNCPLCTENNCECVQLGVGCSNTVCGCLRAGGVVRPSGNLAQTCHNPNGFSVFDQEAVQEYRKRMLFQCREKRD